ncbi:ABC transporter permease [Nonomuraea soli]|uniref:Transport permease protein n=1 Tax=Nonomuraea soli TaxID=1032476 RepID=A0A7W0CGB6_9ACTN|nr:ABC transporter permease [Nonomuraea soli]MBA2890655.1 ABC-2 type transport system permease protein [Nonomuraea soli]
MIRDTGVLLRHYLRQVFKQKYGLVITAAQPLFFLVLFGPLFTRIGSWEVLVPGLIIQLGLMSAGMAGFGIVVDKRFGVLDRLRATRTSRLALLLGRVLSNAAVLLVQATALIAVGYALGLRAPVVGVLLGLAMVIVLGISLASLSYAAALSVPKSLFPSLASTVVVPLMLLSGAFLPMSMAPDWLYALSRANPFTYSVDAMRELFAGHFLTPTVAVGVAVTAAFTAVSLLVGTRIFGRANA